jgi:hypothetical protein
MLQPVRGASAAAVVGPAGALVGALTRCLEEEEHVDIALATLVSLETVLRQVRPVLRARASCIVSCTASCIMCRALHHASCIMHCIMHHASSSTASCIMCRPLHHASCVVVHCIMHHVSSTASCIMCRALHHACSMCCSALLWLRRPVVVQANRTPGRWRGTHTHSWVAVRRCPPCCPRGRCSASSLRRSGWS